MLPTPSDFLAMTLNFACDIVMPLPPQNLNDGDNFLHFGDPRSIPARHASKGLNLVPRTAAPVAFGEHTVAEFGHRRLNPGELTCL